MNYWGTIYRCLCGLAIILFVAVMISFYATPYRTTRDYQKKRYELQQEKRREGAAISDLKRKQELFLTDPAFVERTARESGMVRQDELVIKFTNSPSRRARDVSH